MRRRYPAYVHKDPDSDFGVSFPDFPGCTSVGTSITEALDLAAEALAFHVAGMIEDGTPIPAPSEVFALDDIPERDSLATLAMIEAIVPGRAKRVNVMLDESLLEEIDARAPNRSAFLAAAAREALRKAG